MIEVTVWDCPAPTALDVRMLARLCGGIAESELRSAGAHSVHRDPMQLVPQLETVLS
jgi:hypothetical protein